MYYSTKMVSSFQLFTSEITNSLKYIYDLHMMSVYVTFLFPVVVNVSLQVPYSDE